MWDKLPVTYDMRYTYDRHGSLTIAVFVLTHRQVL